MVGSIVAVMFIDLKWTITDREVYTIFSINATTAEEEEDQHNRTYFSSGLIGLNSFLQSADIWSADHRFLHFLNKLSLLNLLSWFICVSLSIRSSVNVLWDDFGHDRLQLRRRFDFYILIADDAIWVITIFRWWIGHEEIVRDICGAYNMLWEN